MMELNAQMFFGFLLWSAFCLVMLVAERIRSRYWKKAAKSMECHARDCSKRADKFLDAYKNMRTFAEANGLDTMCRSARGQGFERSIPTGVITHAKKQR